MALVAYDYESGSDTEDEANEQSTSTVIIPPQKPDTPQDETTPLGTLLSHLPKTKPTTPKVIEDTLEDFVPKYQQEAPEKKPKVKITIPSLSQFNDDEDDEPTHKRAKSAPKESGLLSLLPPVRGTPLTTKSFVPHVLKKKQTKAKPGSLFPHAVRQKAEASKKAAMKKLSKQHAGSDMESDDDLELPASFDDAMWQKVCGRAKPKPIKPEVVEVAKVPVIDLAPEPVKPYDGLDNAAFKELVGKSKRPVNIKLVDINEDDILPDRDVWLTKSLTDPDIGPKPQVEEPVDPTRKKKHHITYLAEQAKANEQELASQWSANKHSRNQTRAKYGF